MITDESIVKTIRDTHPICGGALNVKTIVVQCKELYDKKKNAVLMDEVDLAIKKIPKMITGLKLGLRISECYINDRLAGMPEYETALEELEPIRKILRGIGEDI